MLAARKMLTLHADILSGLRSFRFVLFITKVVISKIRLMAFYEHREIKSFSGLRFGVRGVCRVIKKKCLIQYLGIVQNVIWHFISCNFFLDKKVTKRSRKNNVVVTCELLFVTGS